MTGYIYEVKEERKRRGRGGGRRGEGGREGDR